MKVRITSHSVLNATRSVAKLIDRDQVYACSCSKERLAELRERQMSAKEKPRYDGHCRGKNIDPQENEVVWRFGNTADWSHRFWDEVYGEVTVANDELDDLILVRSDGVPTYNFTVMVDDHDMGITHVIVVMITSTTPPPNSFVPCFRVVGADILSCAHDSGRRQKTSF